MHAYIGYHSMAALAGPIFVTLLWSNQKSHFYQVDVNKTDADANASMLALVKAVARSFPHHEFTILSVFAVADNVRTVSEVIEADHRAAIRLASSAHKQFMLVLDSAFPTWGFGVHWGMNCSLHRSILKKKKGILPTVHRASFWPCTKYSGQVARRIGGGKLRGKGRQKKSRAKPAG